MKKTKAITKFICFMLAIVLMVTILPIYSEAKTLKTPKLGTWKDVTPTDVEGDGVRYEITWKPVKGENVRYEVKFYEREVKGEKWYTYTKFEYDCSTSLDFSSLYQFKVKVRTVKDVQTKTGSKRVYSKWATSKTFTVH